MISVVTSIIWFVIGLRYRVTVKGLDNLNKETLNKSGGILFIPNHPAALIDPAIIVLAALPKYLARPMVVEYMYYTPIVHWFARKVKAVPVPNFDTSSNSMKQKKNKEVFQSIINELHQGDNFLIYPAGRLKHTQYEALGGASGVHYILQQVSDANVVLVRIKGLWGSSLSRAQTGKVPPLFKTAWEGIKHTLKNLIFFNPRRHIIVEFEPAPADFPLHASKVEFNKWLENYYNRPDGMSPQQGKYPGETLTLVRNSIWSNKLPEINIPKQEIASNIFIDDIPNDVKQKIIHKIAEMQNISEISIKPDMNLTVDLGMDSLDIAELIIFLEEQFDVEAIPAVEMTTVGKMMAIASKQIVVIDETDEEDKDITKWKKPIPKAKSAIPEGKTIPEVFLKICEQKKKSVACGDMRTGIMTYDNLKLRAILLAEKIRQVPEKHVGILLPASIASNLLVLACHMAGKVPVMINWTVGPRHLETVVKLSNIKVVYTSWAFLDHLHNVELKGIEDLLINLEDFKTQISLRDKIRAWWRSKRSTQSIMKTFNIENLTQEDDAVILFTSGSENMPKGVPLTHKNILSNLRGGLETMEISSDDVLYSILPPFHAFGFYIGILGILAGFKTAYFPDPTNARSLAKGFEKWGATIICGAPTFIKGLLKAATPEQIKTMRLCITGAEKAPADLLKLLGELGKLPCFLEGYGITECSPVLTITRPGQPLVGVGQPLNGVELLIVSQDDDKPVKVGERGQILALGPNIFKGYLGQVVTSPFITIEGKEWYKTGDLGFLDEKGNLTISGRIKRFIKIGGEMISLASIEDALLEMAMKKGWSTSEEGPLLAICAKEAPNEKTRIVLFSRFEATIDEVNRFLKEAGFSNIVRITSVNHIPEIPLMGTGKINYRILESKL